MGIVNYLIERLEKSIKDQNDGHIDLSKLTSEEREEAFVQFGEGNANLTRLLKVAYEHDAESTFCCSGHGGPNGYVVFKVNEENLKYLQDVGKVLSKYGVVTNFEEHYIHGKRVLFTGKESSEWFEIAADVMEDIKNFDANNPSLYYHEEMNDSYIPLDYKIKKSLISLLRKIEPQKTFPESVQSNTRNEFREQLKKDVSKIEEVKTEREAQRTKEDLGR